MSLVKGTVRNWRGEGYVLHTGLSVAVQRGNSESVVGSDSVGGCCGMDHNYMINSVYVTLHD